MENIDGRRPLSSLWQDLAANKYENEAKKWTPITIFFKTIKYNLQTDVIWNTNIISESIPGPSSS